MITHILTILLEVLFNSIFIKMCIDDIRTYHVRERDIWILLVSVVVQAIINPQILSKENIFFMLIMLGIFKLIWIFGKNKMGGGDLKILSILTIKYGISILPICLVASLLGVVYGLLLTKRKIPFVPFIYGGVLFLNMILFLSN